MIVRAVVRRRAASFSAAEKLRDRVAPASASDVDPNRGFEVVFCMSEPASAPTLDLQPALLATWHAFQSNPVTFVVAAAIITIAVPLSLTLATGPLMIGLIRIAERALDGEKVEVGELRSGFSDIGRPVIAWFIIAVSVAVGSLIVLPGVALSLLWLYSFWFIVQRNDQLASDALRSSWHLTRSHLPSTVLLGLVLVALNALGLFLALVGFFVSLPLSVLLVTACFRQLADPSGDFGSSSPRPTTSVEEFEDRL